MLFISWQFENNIKSFESIKITLAFFAFSCYYRQVKKVTFKTSVYFFLKEFNSRETASR